MFRSHVLNKIVNDNNSKFFSSRNFSNQKTKTFAHNSSDNFIILQCVNNLTNENKFQATTTTNLFTELDDGRRSGEIARSVLWNSEFCLVIV